MVWGHDVTLSAGTTCSRHSCDGDTAALPSGAITLAVEISAAWRHKCHCGMPCALACLPKQSGARQHQAIISLVPRSALLL